MTTVMLSRLEEARPAMRMWRYLDNLAMIAEMKRWYSFDAVLAEGEDDVHNAILHLARDINTDHRRISNPEHEDYDEEKSKARWAEVDSFLKDAARKERNARGFRPKKVKDSKTGEKRNETDEEHEHRFRVRDMPKRRGESEDARALREREWHKGHRGDGMDAKSFHSALQLMGEHPDLGDVGEALKSQRNRALDPSDLPAGQKNRMDRSISKEVETSADKRGSGAEDTLVTRSAPRHQPEMKMTQRNYKDTVPSRHEGYVALSKNDSQIIRNLKKTGQDEAAEKHLKKAEAELKKKWREDHVDPVTGKHVLAGHKRAYLDDLHGGGALRFEPVKVVKGGTTSYEQPPGAREIDTKKPHPTKPGETVKETHTGWGPDKPRPDSHLDKMARFQSSLTSHAKSVGTGGVAEPNTDDTGAKKSGSKAASAAKSALQAKMLTGHSDYSHYYTDDQVKKAEERLRARRQFIDDQSEGKRTKVEVPIKHPKHSYDAIESATGVSSSHLKNMNLGNESVPVRSISHQILRKADPEYHGYAGPSGKKKSTAETPAETPAEDKPEDDDADKYDDDGDTDKAPEDDHADIDFTKMKPSSVSRMILRSLSSRASSDKKAKRKSDETSTYNSLAASGTAGDSGGVDDFTDSMGKQGERQRVSVTHATDLLLKHPGDKPPEKKEGQSEKDHKEAMDSWEQDKAHHETLTRHVYGNDDKKRRGSIVPGHAAKALLNAKGSLRKEVEEKHAAHKEVVAQAAALREQGKKEEAKALLKKSGLSLADRSMVSLGPEKATLHHASKLLQMSPDDVTALASGVKQKPTRGGRSPADAPVGAASGVSHGAPLKDAIGAENRAAREGAKIDTDVHDKANKDERSTAPVGPRGTGEESDEPYTRKDEISDSLKKDLEHVFPTKMETLAGKDGEPHVSTTRKSHPTVPSLVSEKNLKGVRTLGQRTPAGFSVEGHQPITHADFDEKKYKKKPVLQATSARRKGESVTSRNQRVAEAKEKHKADLAHFNADPEGYLAHHRGEHTAKVDAWHKFLIGRHKDAQDVLSKIFHGAQDPDNKHTADFHRSMKTETPSERKKRKALEDTGQIQRASPLEHHQKVAAADEGVQKKLGLDPRHKDILKHSPTAIRNLVTRFQQNAVHSAHAILHGTGGVPEKITAGQGERKKTADPSRSDSSLGQRVFDPKTHAEKEAEAQKAPPKPPALLPAPELPKKGTGAEFTKKMAARTAEQDKKVAAYKRRVSLRSPEISAFSDAKPDADPEGARLKRSGKAKKKLEREQLTGKDSSGKRVSTPKPVLVGRVAKDASGKPADITTLAGQAPSLRRLPLAGTPAAPSKPMETGRSMAAKHVGAIDRYHSAKAALDGLKGRSWGAARRRNTTKSLGVARAARALRDAHAGLQSVGLDPHNLPKPHAPDVSSPDPETGVRSSTSAGHSLAKRVMGDPRMRPTGKAPRFTGEQGAPKGSKAHAAQTAAMSAGQRTVSGPGGPKPDDSESVKATRARGSAEAEHQLHTQKVNNNKAAVQNYKGSKTDLENLKSRLPGDHPRVQAAQKKHDSHAQVLKSVGIDTSKIGQPSPAERREAVAKAERTTETPRKPGTTRWRPTAPGTGSKIFTPRGQASKPIGHYIQKAGGGRGAPKADIQFTQTGIAPPIVKKPEERQKDLESQASKRKGERKLDIAMGQKPKPKIFVPSMGERVQAARSPKGVGEPVDRPKLPVTTPEKQKKHIGDVFNRLTGLDKQEESRLTRSKLTIQEGSRRAGFFDKVCALA